MITATKRLIQYMQTDRKTYDNRPWERLTIWFFLDKLGLMLPIAAAQMLLLVYYWMLIGPQYYLYFYLLPLATLYSAQIRLRSACEHSFEAGYDVVSERPLVITQCECQLPRTVHHRASLQRLSF